MLKQIELAKALGVSKGAISKRVARGMPLTSVDAATEWCRTNLQMRRTAGPGELTGKAMASAHGRTKGAISKDIGAGMPTDSPESGQHWRALARRRTRAHRLRPSLEQATLPLM